MASAMNLTALVLGATGFIGRHLVERLLQDPRYDRVVLVSRRPSGIDSPKIKEIITNFAPGESLKSRLSGDHLFCALGTTMKKAGNREAFRRVDFDIPVAVAADAQGKVGRAVIISSMGAWADSPNFYLKIKGEMEESVEKLLRGTVTFFRPSILMGDRHEFRGPEEVGKAIMKLIGPLFMGPLRKFRGIDGALVADAMIEAAFHRDLPVVVESDAIAVLGGKYRMAHDLGR